MKVDKKVIKGAKPNDIAILMSLIDKSTFIGLRDVIAILTMYKTIRISTLGQLDERHIEEAYLFHKKVKIQQSLSITFSPNLK